MILLGGIIITGMIGLDRTGYEVRDLVRDPGRNQLVLLLGYTGAEIGQDGLTLSALRRAD